VERHSSPTLVALVQTASQAPMLVLALFAGVLADLFDRRRLLIGVTTYLLVASAVLTALAWADVLTPVGLLSLTFALGCGAALMAPAWQAIQPELVRANRSRRRRRLAASQSTGRGQSGRPSRGWWWPPPGEREPLWQSIVTGIRYIRHGPIVRRILLRAALFGFPASALWALLPVTSAQRWHFGAAGYGLVPGILGVGAVLGVAAIARLRRALSDNVLLTASAAVYAVGLIATAYFPFRVAVVCCCCVACPGLRR
jgi:MFS family permease